MRIRNLVISGLLALIAPLAVVLTPAAAAPSAARVTPTAAATQVAPSSTTGSLATGNRIQNQNSGLCLAARAGSGERPVIQTTCGSWDDQKWVFIASSDGFGYHIKNVALGLCVAARGSNETGVIATTCGEWADQTWAFGTSQIQREAWPNPCIAARGFNEIQAVATTCGSWLDQQWLWYAV